MTFNTVTSVMQAERSNYLQANAYERTEERKGHANGYKPKTVRTKLGDITFAIPQVREGSFYPSAQEKGMRSERALLIAVAETYVQGVSTRRVKAITEELCGVEISAMQVSRAAQQLDEVLQQWRERPLGEIQYLFADARYEKVRINSLERVNCEILRRTRIVGIFPNQASCLRLIYAILMETSEIRYFCDRNHNHFKSKEINLLRIKSYELFHPLHFYPG
ncbi:MAG: transposase [Anaerolineales bacterium]